MINKRKMKSSKQNNVAADQKKPCHTVVYEFKELDNTASMNQELMAETQGLRMK